MEVILLPKSLVLQDFVETFIMYQSQKMDTCHCDRERELTVPGSLGTRQDLVQR